MPSGFGGNGIAYMRKYAQANADLQRWLEDKLAPHRKTHHEAVLAAEAKYKATVEAEPDPDWYRAGTRGWYSKYWQQNHAMFVSYMIKWRESDARRLMEAEIEAADAKFSEDTAELYRIYESRLKMTIGRLGNA